MRIPGFHEIRIILLSPLTADQKEQLLRETSETRFSAKMTVTQSCVLSGVSLIAINTFPILGGIAALYGLAGIITGHDGMMIASNTQELISRDIRQRREIASDEQELHNQLTKGTWLLGPCFRICLPFSSRQAASQ